MIVAAEIEEQRSNGSRSGLGNGQRIKRSLYHVVPDGVAMDCLVESATLGKKQKMVHQILDARLVK